MIRIPLDLIILLYQNSEVAYNIIIANSIIKNQRSCQINSKDNVYSMSSHVKGVPRSISVLAFLPMIPL